MRQLFDAQRASHLAPDPFSTRCRFSCPEGRRDEDARAAEGAGRAIARPAPLRQRQAKRDIPSGQARHRVRPSATSRQAKRDIANECPLGTARREMEADASDVLDDTRTDLNEPLADRRELGVRPRATRLNGRAQRMQPEGGAASTGALLAIALWQGKLASHTRSAASKTPWEPCVDLHQCANYQTRRDFIACDRH
jgi:hypothetical protein